MQHSYSDDRLRLAARLYYLEGMGQADVAKFVKVSQAKVSRLLALARERGIVRISVAEYEPRRRDLEGQLSERYDLDQVAVIKAIDGLSDVDLRRSIGHFAAPILSDIIQPRHTIAVAGGRTIHEVISHLPVQPDRALTVVQAMGSIDSQVNAFDAEEIGRAMVQRLGGNFVALHSPVFMADHSMRIAMSKLAQVRDVRTKLDAADLAIVGIGTLTRSVFVEKEVLTAEEIGDLRTAGTVGEICGHFFDREGNEVESVWRDRVMSVDLEQLRQIPLVVGVVSGSQRTHAIQAAIKGGVLKGLVIDEAGAMALLNPAP